MKRIYLVIVFLILSSIACVLLNTAQPTAAPNTPVAVSTSTKAPTTTSPTGQTIPQVTAGVTPGAPTQEEPTKTPYPTSVLDAQMSQTVNQIQSQVVQERGLQPKYQVPVVLLSPDELKQNVTNDFMADYTDEEMADDVLELTTIGLLQPGFDLHDFYIQLLSEQIAGYYDNDVKEMFVVKGEGFNGPEHLTYAHEFTHVLQDQNYDIENGLKYSDDACEVDTERCAAVQALIEGDATLSEFTWFQNFASRQDQQQIIDYMNSLKSPVYDSSPAFLKDDFVFPYNQGFEFVQSIFNNGGWDAVDKVYQNPPVSTEQILHPELYPSDTPIPVDLPDLAQALGDGWREVSRNQMGEWYTFLILARSAIGNANLSDDAAKAAAAGWGGDEYLVLHNDSSNLTAFVMKTVWDKDSDATEFAAAFKQYADRRFGVAGSQQGDTLSWSYSGGYSSFVQSGATTIWINAPDAATAQTISGSVTP